MRWFKHQSDMRYDAKIRRVISKFGVAGYGVYNFALEAITQRLDKESPIPELEDTASDIAEYLNMDTVKVEEIMLFCLQQGLFEQSETTGRILCGKIYKYIDKASTRSTELRTMIEAYKDTTDCPRLSETNTDKVDRTEQNRIEENRTEEKKRFSKPSLKEVEEYCKERKNNIDAEHFIAFYESKGWMIGKNKMVSWKKAIETWEKRDKKENQPQQQNINDKFEEQYKEWAK